MHHIHFRAMGCHMAAMLDITPAHASEAAQIEAQVAQVPQWFEQWEQQFSRFRPESELSKLNQTHGWQKISEDLSRALATALQAAEWSNGLVVPTTLDALEQAGYTRAFEPEVSSPPTLEAAGHTPTRVLNQVPLTDWREIKLNPRQQRVFLPEGARLDLGGTAKGWAAQQAARKLSTIAPALVDAGGDIAISGPRAGGTAWVIGIDGPTYPTHQSSKSSATTEPETEPEPIALAMLNASAKGIATSGRDYRHWVHNGVQQHHIIDPRIGLPAVTDVMSATVIAPSTVMAEIAAKAVLILGSKDGMDWIESNTLLAALLVLDDGTDRGPMVHSTRMKDYLWK